jgi:hypothetical protein
VIWPTSDRDLLQQVCSMSATSFLRALVKRDLNVIRRVLFQQPLFRSGADSGETPAAAPEEIGWDSQREQQGAADRIAGVGTNRADHDIGRREKEQR